MHKQFCNQSSVYDLRNAELRQPIEINYNNQGTYTIDGQYIPPTNSIHSDIHSDTHSNSELVSCLYICAGEYIKSTVESSTPVKLSSDTKLFYTTNIHGTINGCKLKINYKKNISIKSNPEDESSIPVGYSRAGKYESLAKSVKSNKKSNPALAENKLYVNNVSFYMNGFAITNNGLQEITIEPGTKLKIIKSDVLLLDEDNKWVNIVPSNMVFKYTGTEYDNHSNSATNTNRQKISVKQYIDSESDSDSESNNDELNPTKHLKDMILNLSEVILKNIGNKKIKQSVKSVNPINQLNQQKPIGSEIFEQTNKPIHHNNISNLTFGSIYDKKYDYFNGPSLFNSESFNHLQNNIAKEKPFKTTQSTQSTQPTKSTQSTQSTQPNQPTQPTQSTQSTQQLNDVQNMVRLIYSIKKKQDELAEKTDQTNPESQSDNDITECDCDSESECDSDDYLNLNLN